MARLLAANLVPEVWVPPVHVRELRQLISQRRRQVEMHTKVVNRRHSVSHLLNLGHPKGKHFKKKDMAWREPLSKMERFQLELDLETKQYLKGQIGWLTKRPGTLRHQTPWAAMAMYLMQIPGFGVITAMTVIAHQLTMVVWHLLTLPLIGVQPAGFLLFVQTHIYLFQQPILYFGYVIKQTNC